MHVVDEEDSKVEFILVVSSSTSAKRPNTNFLQDRSIKQHLALPHGQNARGSKPRYFKGFDNLFRCFYSLDPDWSDLDEDHSSSIRNSVQLIQIAEQIGASRPVRRVIESNLLGHGPVLWAQVADLPTSYADLAFRLKSPSIFKEAMVHMIGSWRLDGGPAEDDVSEFDGVGTVIHELARRKVEELDELKEQVELEILDFIPPSLKKQNIAGKPPGNEKCECSVNTYKKLDANISSTDNADLYRWQAYTLIQRYISKALYNNEGRVAQDGGADFYRKLNQGGNAYLLPDEVRDWHGDFPMSDKGHKKFREAVEAVKNEYRPLTAPLLVNNGLPFAADAPPLPYLTLAIITEADFPWKSEEEEMKESYSLDNDSSNINTTASNTPQHSPGSRQVQAGPQTQQAPMSANNASQPQAGTPDLSSTPISTGPKRSARESFGDEDPEI